jgi:hypothetical protein
VGGLKRLKPLHRIDGLANLDRAMIAADEVANGQRARLELSLRAGSFKSLMALGIRQRQERSHRWHVDQVRPSARLHNPDRSLATQAK